MITNNYDSIAGSYDALSRLVFFKAQVNAQIRQLHYIEAGSRILIVGGGTGWILEEISKIHPEGLDITYVELSGKMLDRARKRNYGRNQVLFLHANIEEFKCEEHFDVIHTAFLFDNFEVGAAVWVFHLLLLNLEPGGIWLYTDFKIEPGERSGWKPVMLKIMYAFFSRVADVDATRLPPMDQFFSNNDCELIDEERYYKGFIESKVFQKSLKLPTFS